MINIGLVVARLCTRLRMRLSRLRVSWATWFTDASTEIIGIPHIRPEARGSIVAKL